MPSAAFDATADTHESTRGSTMGNVYEDKWPPQTQFTVSDTHLP